MPNRYCIAIASVLVLIAGCASNSEFRQTPGAVGVEGNGNPGTIPTAELNLALCKTRVSNAPASTRNRVDRRSATACLNGVDLLVAPAPGACLTSGFGVRRGRNHAGMDYQRKPAGPVVSAADGKVHEVGFRQKDFGNWIIIDHGNGTYTSYAHLQRFAPGIVTGTFVKQGRLIGTMGKTGNATNAVHLHVEYRTGNITKQGWFGLKPVNPFALPGKCN